MTRKTRQLENGHEELGLNAIVEAWHRVTGKRGVWRAVQKLDAETWRFVAEEGTAGGECRSQHLIIHRVLRRGFGE